MFFKKGDIVRWTSQAAGVRNVKEGVVVEVLDEGQVPEHKIRWPGMSRNHESYLIKARVVESNGTPVEGRRVKYYWPKVKNLELVRPCNG